MHRNPSPLLLHLLRAHSRPSLPSSLPSPLPPPFPSSLSSSLPSSLPPSLPSSRPSSPPSSLSSSLPSYLPSSLPPFFPSSLSSSLPSSLPPSLPSSLPSSLSSSLPSSLPTSLPSSLSSSLSSPLPPNLPSSRLFASLCFRAKPLRPVGAEALPFREKPRSLGLRHSGEGEGGAPSVHDAPPRGAYGLALRLLGYYSKEAKLIRGSRALYEQIVSRAEDGTFFKALNLEKNFRSTYSILTLHMWLSLVRMRGEADGKQAGQLLYDIFYHDVEQRVVAEGVKVLISKWMKELEKSFYGAALAYDKALLPSAAADELPRALWRNVFAEDASEMPTGNAAEPVQALARYVRRETASLALTDSESFMKGMIRFSSDYGEGLEKV